MKLAEAIARFLDHHSPNAPTVDPHIQSESPHQTLLLLTQFFPTDATLTEIAPSAIRDFLSRWYVEKSYDSKPVASRFDDDDRQSNNQSLPPQSIDQLVEALDLMNSIEALYKWFDQQTGGDQAVRVSPLLNELRRTLPRALAITNALTNALRQSGGAFSFPEFLTSFEEGGSSQYDIDVPGNIGALDGYFRIRGVKDLLVEAEEMITEERVWPIIFPAEAAALLENDYIINMELIRKGEVWEIVGCGFAYPPRTEID